MLPSNIRLFTKVKRQIKTEPLIQFDQKEYLKNRESGNNDMFLQDFTMEMKWDESKMLKILTFKHFKWQLTL